jgi:hypothetical protein
MSVSASQAMPQLAATASQPVKKHRPEDDVVLPAPATTEQLRQAESVLRQLRAAQIKGQTAEASKLLAKALQVAPGSPEVLEALGDDFVARRNIGEARLAYYKASKMAPNNVRIERKYAETVFSASGFTWEMKAQQDAEVAATAKWATVLSVILPGAGQLVLRQWVKGGVLMFAAGVAATLLLPSLNVVKGHSNHFTGFFWGMLATYLVVWLISLIDCSLQAKDSGLGGISQMGAVRSSARPKVERPVPPVNLPFE